MPYADIRHDRLRAKRKRAEAIAAGLCLQCHKVPPEPGRRRCAACQAKLRVNQKLYMARQRQAAKRLGICLQCLKRQVIPDLQCCGYCQEVQEEYHRKVRKHRRKETKP